MIIKQIAFGNRFEAFIENRFKENTNIIFSNDNNRGKMNQYSQVVLIQESIISIQKLSSTRMKSNF